MFPLVRSADGNDSGASKDLAEGWGLSFEVLVWTMRRIDAGDQTVAVTINVATA